MASKKPKNARKTKQPAPKPRLGEVTFGPDGASIITFNHRYNSQGWTHHADALIDIVAPSWSWSYPGIITIVDHTTGRRIA